jgi:hypothetical protein
MAIGGINSLGIHKYFTRLFRSLGITMPPSINHYLAFRDNSRTTRLNKRKDKAAKKARKKKFYEKMKEGEKTERVERLRQEGTYKSGQNMADGGADGYTEEQLAHAAADGYTEEELQMLLASATGNRSRKKKRPKVICPFCNKPGHSTRRSKNCLQYIPKGEPKDPPTNEAVDPPAQQGDSVDDVMESFDAMDAMQINDDVSTLEEFVDADTWSDGEDDEPTPTWITGTI